MKINNNSFPNSPEGFHNAVINTLNKINDDKEINIVKEKSRKRIKIFKRPTAAVACVFILSVVTVSAAATIHHYWGRAMQGTIRATDEQQQSLTNQGVASVLSENENYADIGVTDGNVTITPETVIVDDKFAFVSFSVQGYTIGNGVEPGFEHVGIYLGDEPNADAGRVNTESSFYDGIVSDENGNPIYDNGTPLKFTEDGRVISRYENDKGNLEYVVSIHVTNYNDSLLGKTLHLNFENLGTLYKSEYKGALEGTWNFSINLSNVSSAKDIKIEKEVSGTDFVLDSIELSPISIKMNYTVNGKVSIIDDENGVPDFCGVVLKDGKRIPYISNGGMTGYTDNTLTSAYALSAFDRVIQVEQIESLLVRTERGTDMVEIPLDRK